MQTTPNAPLLNRLDRFDPESIKAACLALFDVQMQGRPVCECTPQDTDAARVQLARALRADGPIVACVQALDAGGMAPGAVQMAASLIVGWYVMHVQRDDGKLHHPDHCGVKARDLRGMRRDAVALRKRLEHAGLATRALDDQVAELDRRLAYAQRIEARAEAGEPERGAPGAPTLLSTGLVTRLDSYLRAGGAPKRHDLIAAVVSELFDESLAGEAVRSRLKDRKRRAAR